MKPELKTILESARQEIVTLRSLLTADAEVPTDSVIERIDEALEHPFDSFCNSTFISSGFEGISLERINNAYQLWLLVMEKGCKSRMMFWPSGKISYQHSNEEEEAAIKAAFKEWSDRKIPAP